MPMQYPAIFHNGEKNVRFFLIFAQNIDCGYTLEPTQCGGSSEYPQLMFWSKNKKIMYTPVNLIYSIYKTVECKGSSFHGHVCMMLGDTGTRPRFRLLQRCVYVMCV